MANQQEKVIYVISDALGETAESVVRATLRQFDQHQVTIKRYGHIKQEEEIRQLAEDAAESGGFVVYTLVQPELRETMKQESIRLGFRAVDIMGPMMQAFVDTYNGSPKSKPGLLHEMDEAYFRRVEAIEFAVKYDDGRDAKGLLQAQIVLIGVSRTSKTPLSIFLAHKGIKVANLPLMPEVKLPDELSKIPGQRIVGLTMSATHILNIRLERLKTLGLPHGAQYATMSRILEELDYAQHVMKKVGCKVIDVTNKAIEETAGIIIGSQFK